MDRLIYTALSGMQASMDRQRAIASNMANSNTIGFRAELIEQRAVTIEGHPNEARAMQTARVTGADMSGGELFIVLIAMLGGATRVSTPFMFVALGECVSSDRADGIVLAPGARAHVTPLGRPAPLQDTTDRARANADAAQCLWERFGLWPPRG